MAPELLHQLASPLSELLEDRDGRQSEYDGEQWGRKYRFDILGGEHQCVAECIDNDRYDEHHDPLALIGMQE